MPPADRAFRTADGNPPLDRLSNVCLPGCDQGRFARDFKAMSIEASASQRAGLGALPLAVISTINSCVVALMSGIRSMPVPLSTTVVVAVPSVVCVYAASVGQAGVAAAQGSSPDPTDMRGAASKVRLWTCEKLPPAVFMPNCAWFTTREVDRVAGPTEVELFSSG